MEIRSMQPADWQEVSRIYLEGISTGIATFETSVPMYAAWDAAHMPSCRLVAAEGRTLLGWAALSPVSSRCVYGGVAEVSIYIGSAHRGKGVGKKLMQALIKASEAENLWTLQSGIFPQNRASILLHEKTGFRYIGKRERVGKRGGTWYDNLLYERRSSTIGND
jgi:L-amino acid N-acyltransferase YncA